MPLFPGPRNDQFNDLFGGITGGSAPVGGTDRGYRFDDPARFGALDAPAWVPTGSHRMAGGSIIYAEDVRPGTWD